LKNGLVLPNQVKPVNGKASHESPEDDPCCHFNPPYAVFELHTASSSKIATPGRGGKRACHTGVSSLLSPLKKV
jgi:hypothetical protein